MYKFIGLKKINKLKTIQLLVFYVLIKLTVKDFELLLKC